MKELQRANAQIKVRKQEKAVTAERNTKREREIRIKTCIKNEGFNERAMYVLGLCSMGIIKHQINV